MTKLWYFTNLDFPELRGLPFLSYLLGVRSHEVAIIWPDFLLVNGQEFNKFTTKLEPGITLPWTTWLDKFLNKQKLIEWLETARPPLKWCSINIPIERWINKNPIEISFPTPPINSEAGGTEAWREKCDLRRQGHGYGPWILLHISVDGSDIQQAKQSSWMYHNPRFVNVNGTFTTDQALF